MLRWKTLAKYLSGEADEKEKAKISRWISKNKNNLKAFEDIKMYWNQIGKSEISEIDTDKAWNRVKSRIDAEEDKSFAKDRSVISLNKTLLRYAAVILVVIGIGTGAFFTYQQINPSVPTVTIDTPEHIKNKEVVLPDGSVAYLNYDSELNYPRQFETKRREVTIKGEVFFNVKNDISKPFIINTNNAQIEVLGTEFNVNTNLPNNKVEVLVQSGKVKVSRKSNRDEHIVVETGYKGIVSEKVLEMVKNKDANYLAWTTERLIFRGEKLGEVSEILMRTYNVQIDIRDPEIRNYRITTNFTEEPIDSVLNVIATTFNLEINTINENKYVIKNNSD
ncbi:MAG: FecR family protein [Bacteroidales bacterium]